MQLYKWLDHFMIRSRMILVHYQQDYTEHLDQNLISPLLPGSGDIFVVYHTLLYLNSASAVYLLVYRYLQSTS